ncbi:CRISPR-associated DxTHG motif protein [Methanothermobacter marburgensis]
MSGHHSTHGFRSQPLWVL